MSRTFSEQFPVPLALHICPGIKVNCEQSSYIGEKDLQTHSRNGPFGESFISYPEHNPNPSLFNP